MAASRAGRGAAAVTGLARSPARELVRARLLTHMERAGEPAPLIEPAHP